MAVLVGRESEQRTLSEALASEEPELVAVYGRRRVGKTFLVREFFGEAIAYELTGSQGAPVIEQLRNHARALGAAVRSSLPPAPPADWPEAFAQLATHLGSIRSKKRVVFLDELPWLAGRRSGFLRAFQHFWNSWASRQRNLVVVVCGSAAAWMLSKVVAAKGGLHNRVTRRIRLLPFTLHETQAFLGSRGVKLSPHGIAELYMSLGGIPHYLKDVQRGDSAAAAVDRLCFSRDGSLRDEFEKLYRSLFESADEHVAIIRALAKKASGMTRGELIDALGGSTGGGLTARLLELEESGFVSRTPRFGHVTKDAVHRLTDEYSLFYLKWIERRSMAVRGEWMKVRGTPAFRAWSGFAFEGLCLKHTTWLKRALGIEGVATTESSWSRRASAKDQRGAQIDLVVDRADGCINLCEMKFSESEFVIDKAYAADLASKRRVFQETTRTRKSLFITLVTPHGIRQNEYAKDLVAAQITLPALFRAPP